MRQAYSTTSENDQYAARTQKTDKIFKPAVDIL